MDQNTSATAPKTVNYLDGYTPEHLYAEDHFRVLLHIDAVCAELNDGFEVGFDPLMRFNKRTFNVLYKRALKPKRPANYPPYKNSPRGKTVTILKDGTQVIDGDDICCLHDMAETGYIARLVDGEFGRADAIHVGVGTVIYLSPRGKQVVAALRRTIAESGHYKDFTPPPALDGFDLPTIELDDRLKLRLNKM